MEYVIGIVIALAVAGFARVTGFDRDRAFYPAMVIVIALYYVLFAVMGASTQALVVELVAMVAFAVVAVVGFKFSSWIIVAGLVAHGLFDACHELLVTNPGVPEWWAGFCMTCDIGLAGALALLVRRDFARQETGLLGAHVRTGVL